MLGPVDFLIMMPNFVEEIFPKCGHQNILLYDTTLCLDIASVILDALHCTNCLHYMKVVYYDAP